MMEMQYSEIGEAIGVSCARQAELLGNLLLYATRGDAMTDIDTFSDSMDEEKDPVEETIPILKWIAREPSLTVEERIFLAHRTGILLPLQSDEAYEDDEFTIDEEDQEMREILRAFLQSEEGKDTFHPIIDDLESDETGEDESEGE